jgi:hypothetical protein
MQKTTNLNSSSTEPAKGEPIDKTADSVKIISDERVSRPGSRVGRPDNRKLDNDARVGRPDNRKLDNDARVGRPDNRKLDNDARVGRPDNL